MLPDIDSLALLVRAVELRSLTKAAEASHIGLAAASRRIALLEHRFKTQLLERTPRGVEPTPAGSALVVHAKALLMHINQMQSEMNDFAAGLRGAIRVLANTSAMTEFLPADLARFSQHHPGVRVAVEERWSAEIVRAVQAAQADVGIIVEGLVPEGLDLFPYRTDRLSAVVPPGHPLATVPLMRYVDVLEHDIVALESGSSMMRLLAEQAVSAGMTLQLRVQVRSFEAVCRMVQSGLGVGLLPYQAAHAIAAAMELVVRPLPEDWAEREMLVCVRKDRPTAGVLPILLDHLIRSGSDEAPSNSSNTASKAVTPA